MTNYASTSEGTDVITVLVPNYDKGPYLRAAIDSLLVQTDPDWRAIVLDDCSTDESRQIVASYAPLRDLYRMLPRSLSPGPEARPIAKKNHEYATATALAWRNGDPRAVRRALEHA